MTREPNDGNAWVNVADLYIRKATETGNPLSYTPARTAVDNARQLLNDAPESLLVGANLALTQHRFGDALDLLERVRAEQPNRAAVLIPLIDALVETGRYEDASKHVDQLMQLRPSVAAFSRRSYLRQLRGDITGAIDDMRQAVRIAPEGSQEKAVALGYLGDVELERGNVPNARTAYDQALAISPSLPHAVIGRATLEATLGQVDIAANRLGDLIDISPLPGAIALRAEIRRSTANTSEAEQDDELLDATVKLFEAGGSVLDAEFAVALADRGNASSVDIARTAYKERQTIFTADALAWSLYRSGRALEAVSFAKEAIARNPAVGTIRAHAALIFAKVGQIELAKNELRLAHRNTALMHPLPELLDELTRALG